LRVVSAKLIWYSRTLRLFGVGGWIALTLHSVRIAKAAMRSGVPPFIVSKWPISSNVSDH
jgi:hypothetical protein